MTTTVNVDQVLASLPSPIPAGGRFTVTAAEQFPSDDGTASTTYSYPLMDPANVVGGASQPYIPVALPAYVSTLYNNVYNINTNLEKSILSAAVETERKYPTSYAVQQYVQSQLAGYQLISGENIDVITTSLSNTLIRSVPPLATKYIYQYNNGSTSSSKDIAMFYMNTQVNASRNGASKLVVMADEDWLKLDGAITGQLAFLYAGDDAENAADNTVNHSHFIYMGQKFKYYQFVILGDCLSFVQAYDPVSSSWNWIVTNSMGIFSNEIKLSSGTISRSSDAADLVYPNPDII